MFEVLVNNPLFHSFSSEMIDSFLNDLNGDMREFKKGSVAFECYLKSKQVMFLLHGVAKVEQYNEDGSSVFFKRLKVGDVFGVVSIFSNEDYYPTHIVFEEDSVVLCLDEKSILKLLNKDVQLLKNYLVFYNGQVQYLLNRISILSIVNSEDRLMHYFSKLPRVNEIVELTISKIELSEYLGLSRSTLYRAFDKLVLKNNIEINDKIIRLKYL